MKRPLPLALVALVALAPRIAFADPPKSGAEAAAAEVLFYEARQLMDKGRYAEACPKLEESLRVDRGIGTQFNLADCNEHIGKLATAWAGFLEVAAVAKTKSQLDREKVARKRAAALEPRLPRLAIDVPATVPAGAEVRRDGLLVGSAAWGSAVPVDTGLHRVNVSSPGRQWETTVHVGEGKTARVSVPRELPVTSIASVTTTTAATPVASGAVTTETMNDPYLAPVVEHGSAQRTLGWVVAGVGAVGLGLGAGFGIASLNKRDASHSHCAGDTCDAEGVALRNEAINNGTIATVSTLGGAAGVIGGLLLVLTAPKAARETAGTVRAYPTAAIGGGGLTLQGVFQ